MSVQTNIPVWKITPKRAILSCGVALSVAVCAFTVAQANALHAAAPQVPDAVSLGDRIVAFARAHLGHAVGDGECYDLADQALRHAGAKSAPDYGEITADADYVWGQPVALRNAQPGDIIQFHNFTLKTTVVGTDGFYGTSQRWETDVREHHTSIVERNLGGVLILLEQNVEPGLVVQRTTLAVASGTVDGSPDGAPANATTTYEVAGEAHAYRPQIGDRLLARE